MGLENFRRLPPSVVVLAVLLLLNQMRNYQNCNTRGYSGFCQRRVCSALHGLRVRLVEGLTKKLNVGVISVRCVLIVSIVTLILYRGNVRNFGDPPSHRAWYVRSGRWNYATSFSHAVFHLLVAVQFTGALFHVTLDLLVTNFSHVRALRLSA